MNDTPLTPKRPLVFFGLPTATRHLLEKADMAKINRAFQRHFAFDWSDCYPEDRRSNEEAVENGARIFGVYNMGDGLVIWIITEAEDDEGQRQYTTAMLPGDY